TVEDGRVCLAGLHTGQLHNKVYGTGQLLVNLAYASTAAGRTLQETLEREVEAGLEEFAARFGELPDFARTAADRAKVTTVRWLKSGLPALDQRDPWAERLLGEAAGIPYASPSTPACTCDAIWMHGVDGAYTAVLGPGDLGANNAHAEGEYADSADQEVYATSVTALLKHFARETDGPL